MDDDHLTNEFHDIGRQLAPRIELPETGSILLIGRPHDIDGMGFGLAQGLALRSRAVSIACLWMKGMAMGRPGPATSWSLVQRYMERTDDVGLALVVRNVVTRPEEVRTPLLWASDRIAARAHGLACAGMAGGVGERLDAEVEHLTNGALRVYDRGHGAAGVTVPDAADDIDRREMLPFLVIARRAGLKMDWEPTGMEAVRW